MKGLFRRRSLIFRLLLLSVAAVVLPALLISAIYRSISSRALLKTIEQEQTELARRIAEEVNSEIHHAQGLVELVSRSSFFSAGSRIDQYEALHNLLKEAPAFQEAMFVSASGMEVLKVRQIMGSARLARRPEDLRQSYIGAPFFSGNRSPTILIGEPIRSFANPSRTGAVVAKMSFTRLGALMTQAMEGRRGVACIVDSKGMVLAHPDEQMVFSHSNWSRRPVVQEWFSKRDQPTGLTHYMDETGEEHLSLAYPIPLLKSAVIIEQPKADVYAPLEHMRQQFILWTLVSVLIFILIAIAVSWRILKPLRQLRVAVEEVGQGKREVHLNIHTHDEIEELATTFEKMTQSLAELERVRRDLISMIVHDLKMPLSTILPSLESLLVGDMGKLTKDQSYFVQMARRSSQEMLMLIQNLLDVAKMEEGKLKLQRDLFSPADWADGVVANFRPLAEAAKKTLHLTIVKGVEPVEGDAALLARVLGNLVSNALRHIPAASGEVSVTLYPDGNQLAVEVRDNGEGIPVEEQKSIFDKFVQGESHSANLRSGTGLGLTFCKMVIEAHGGQITLYSQPKEGSVFTFHIPYKEVARSSPSSNANLAAQL